MHNKSPSPLSLLYFKLRLCGWNDFTLPGGRNLLLGVSSEKQTLFWIALRYFVERSLFGGMLSNMSPLLQQTNRILPQQKILDNFTFFFFENLVVRYLRLKEQLLSVDYMRREKKGE